MEWKNACHTKRLTTVISLIFSFVFETWSFFKHHIYRLLIFIACSHHRLLISSSSAHIIVCSAVHGGQSFSFIRTNISTLYDPKLNKYEDFDTNTGYSLPPRLLPRRDVQWELYSYASGKISFHIELVSNRYESVYIYSEVRENQRSIWNVVNKSLFAAVKRIMLWKQIKDELFIFKKSSWPMPLHPPSSSSLGKTAKNSNNCSSLLLLDERWFEKGTLLSQQSARFRH